MNNDQQIVLGVAEFVALVNQSFDYAFPYVTIQGELANLRVSKNRWLYFDIKDDDASIKCFGTVYHLPGPLEDGMMLRITGQPRLHKNYGFSFNITQIQPAGEGTIKRAAELLRAKLANEGLFDESRKRALPYPPRRLGLITSRQSAAYADFMKIINNRWQGVEVQVIDVQVQGDAAVPQIMSAIEQFNTEPDPPQVLVLVRGGGSPEDLAAFSHEHVTRAVAASRIPTLVAIGHEIDVNLAELAADRRASTPSNAAELLVPDRKHVGQTLSVKASQLSHVTGQLITQARRNIQANQLALQDSIKLYLGDHRHRLTRQSQLLDALSPKAIMRRGYAVVRHNKEVVRSVSALSADAIVNIQLADGDLRAKVTETKENHD